MRTYYMMCLRTACLLLAALVIAGPATAQNFSSLAPSQSSPYSEAPRPYEILGISVDGVEDATLRDFVRQSSGLQQGEQVVIPGDPAVADAIRAIYELGMFSDVSISVERKVGDGVFLAIDVERVPRLEGYSFRGIDDDDAEEIRKQSPLIERSPVRPADIARTQSIIRNFYLEKGYPDPTVQVRRTVNDQENTVQLDFVANLGRRVEIEDVSIIGNEAISDWRLLWQMDETNEDRWWRIWKASTFKPDGYEADLERLVQYYKNKGYFDARIVRDTVYVGVDDGEEGVIVEIEVHEGERYSIRNIDWVGNTIYTDQTLTRTLGFEQGDIYDASKLESNLYGSPQGNDVSSLYMDRGYLRFNVQPSIEVVGDNQLDVTFQVTEGETYEFGDIQIAGNTKTKEHVIRRELYTVPGQTFSRAAIRESIRRLSQLKYFDQEQLTAGPAVEINEESQTVDLTYSLQEVGSDQLSLSGTYSGSIGVILQTQLSFNNFSAQNFFNPEAWSPLPSGDGQKLSLSVQTNGRRYQRYSVSFTEPWFKGSPTPVGFSLAFSRLNYGTQNFAYGTASGFFQRRLSWPDDKFSTSTSVKYGYYNNIGSSNIGLPTGVNHEITVEQSLSRNSLDNPVFPSEGSDVGLSLEVAPPLPGFIQYHKWNMQTEWWAPLMQDVSLGVATRFGYIGSLTGEEPQFQRYIVGGSPLDAQGINSYFGKDVIFMRGYPAAAVGPRINRGGDLQAVGGRILNKYSLELRWMALQSQRLTLGPYLFLDAANTWNGFDTYNPAQLYRSAGLGAKVQLPMLGMVELTYGYNFDTFVPVGQSSHSGARQWYFQFSIGRGF